MLFKRVENHEEEKKKKKNRLTLQEFPRGWIFRDKDGKGKKWRYKTLELLEREENNLYCNGWPWGSSLERETHSVTLCNSIYQLGDLKSLSSGVCLCVCLFAWACVRACVSEGTVYGCCCLYVLLVRKPILRKPVCCLLLLFRWVFNIWSPKNTFSAS